MSLLSRDNLKDVFSYHAPASPAQPQKREK